MCYGCRLTNQELQAVGSLPKLRMLDIEFYRDLQPTQLQYSSLAFLQKSPLKTLRLHSTAELLTDVPRRQRLQCLKLHGRRLFAELCIPSSLSALSKLQELSLSGQTELSGNINGLSCLAQLTCLEFDNVWLADSESWDELRPAIANMRCLQSLNVESSQVRVEEGLLSFLTALTALSLVEQRIGSSDADAGGPFAIPSECSKLVSLDLSENELQYLPPGIAHLSALTMLDISGQAVPDGDADEPEVDEQFEDSLDYGPRGSSGLQLDGSLVDIVRLPLLKQLDLSQGPKHRFSDESFYHAVAAQEALQAANGCLEGISFDSLHEDESESDSTSVPSQIEV